MFKWDIQSATEPLLANWITFSYSRNDLQVAITVDIYATFITRYFSTSLFNKGVKSNDSNQTKKHTLLLLQESGAQTPTTIWRVLKIIFVDMSYQLTTSDHRMFGNNTVFFNFLKKTEQRLLVQDSHQDVVGGCKVIAMVFRMVARVAYWPESKISWICRKVVLHLALTCHTIWQSQLSFPIKLNLNFKQ